MYYPLTIFSLILAAVGGILIWGVNATVSGINVDAIGAVILVVAVVAFTMSFLPLRSR